MPTSMWKGVYLFNAANYGWAEQWYLPSESFGGAMTSMKAVAPSRIEMLGNFANLIAIKVYDTAAPGVAYLEQFVTPPKPSASTNTRGQPYDAIYVKCTDAGRQYRRQMWIRGEFDDEVAFSSTTGLPAVPQRTLASLKKFSVAAFAQSFAMRCVTKFANNSDRKIITLITAPGPGDFYTFLCPAHGFAQNAPVRISGNKGLGLVQYQRGKILKVNAIWFARVIDANTFSIDLKWDPTGEPIYVTKYGYARARVPTFPIIYNYELQRFSKRDTGRPFFLPVGRRSVKP